MDIVLLILSGLFMVVGVLGSILPALPGLPLSYVGLLLLHFTSYIDYSVTFLLVWLGVVIVVTIMDNVIPLWTTKVFGGSKWAVWGSVIGLLVGMFIPPVGIILGTLIGAIVGEMLYGKPLMESFKSGIGSLVGFMLTTGIKLICCGFMFYYFIRDVYGVIVG